MKIASLSRRKKIFISW